MPHARTLIEKIQALPPEQLSEVEDFVDFLSAKARRLAALDRLLAIAPALDAAGVPPMTEEEALAEVDAVRASQRALRNSLRPRFSQFPANVLVEFEFHAYSATGTGTMRSRDTSAP